MRLQGPHVVTISKVIPEAYVAETFEQAVAFSRQTTAPVATLDGDVLRGPHLVSGGAKVESRGILATRREIKELRERVASDRQALTRLAADAGQLEITIAQATSAIAALVAEQHRQEMDVVALRGAARAQRRGWRSARPQRRGDCARAQPRGRRARDRWKAAAMRRNRPSAGSAKSSVRRTSGCPARSDSWPMPATPSPQLGAQAAEVRASHAALVERASALAAEVERLEEGARELEQRIAFRAAELDQTRSRREALLTSVADSVRTLDADIRALEAMRQDLRTADDAATAVRSRVEAQDAIIRDARRALEDVRAGATDLEVGRATAESDLTHLAQSCIDGVQASLDEVLADVEQMEAAGETTPDAAAISAEEPDPDDDEESVDVGRPRTARARASSGRRRARRVAPSVDDRRGSDRRLKAKIDRLGPVNMMAIEQFDELEERHTFLTTQRRDLIDSIAQTSEAIKRIDETSKVRFREAFTAIQHNFQGTFSTLFGGGRAGLTLLDENDPLESGIDIVASPPGKRLQSVQLLSGGEKALTAIALMFAIFQYKPSPFCLLDEIDAPLDDANVGRFVDMLRGMLDRTQFILITHNRRTMEIANRLYGVTMEEPGVSKLISVQLN